MIPRHPRDPKHHVCVDRQTYHAMGSFLVGVVLLGGMLWLGVPGWLTTAVLAVALLMIPALHLLADGEERRKAALTPEDKAAGRW